MRVNLLQGTCTPTLTLMLGVHEGLQLTAYSTGSVASGGLYRCGPQFTAGVRPRNQPWVQYRGKEKRKTMDLVALETEALKLNPRLRAKLAEKLLQSLETLSEAENEQLWAEEALRRHEDLETNTAVARSAEEVLRDARARLS